MRATGCSLGFLMVTGSLLASALPDQIRAGLTAEDREVANQAIAACVERGVEALPQLRQWSSSDDPRLRVRSRAAIGQLTGQWGSQTDLIWGRSFEAAKGQGKPILYLQLFGKLDEEFC